MENIFEETFNDKMEPFIKWKLLFNERNRLIHCKIEDVYKKADVYDSISEEEELAKLGDYLYKNHRLIHRIYMKSANDALLWPRHMLITFVTFLFT